jgi:hypothetical protein
VGGKHAHSQAWVHGMRMGPYVACHVMHARILCMHRITSTESMGTQDLRPHTASCTYHGMQTRLRYKYRKRTHTITSALEEIYLRDEIPCGFECGNGGCPRAASTTLSLDAPFLIIPDDGVLDTYLEVFELPDVANYVLCSSVVRKVRGGRRARAQERVGGSGMCTARVIHVTACSRSHACTEHAGARTRSVRLCAHLDTAQTAITVLCFAHCAALPWVRSTPRAPTCASRGACARCSVTGGGAPTCLTTRTARG